MTEDRERHLIRQIESSTSVGEVMAMRQQIIANGEAITTDLLAAISRQIAMLGKTRRGRQ